MEPPGLFFQTSKDLFHVSNGWLFRVWEHIPDVPWDWNIYLYVYHKSKPNVGIHIPVPGNILHSGWPPEWILDTPTFQEG